MNAAELLGIALAPGVAIMLYIYLKDKHEREPLSLLLISFVYGMVSTLLTLFISTPINFLVVLREDDYLHEFYSAFFKVALVEEFSKFVFVRFILFPNKNFNEPFDGIVYAVMVGMGFATLENVIIILLYWLILPRDKGRCLLMKSNCLTGKDQADGESNQRPDPNVCPYPFDLPDKPKIVICAME